MQLIKLLLEFFLTIIYIFIKAFLHDFFDILIIM